MAAAIDEPTDVPAADAATDDVAETTEEIVEQVHTALAIRPNQKKWTADQVAVMKALGWQDVEQMTPAEIMHFSYFCAENRVNPLLRQAMPLKTKDGVVPIMQIAGMRKRADDTGEFEGLTPHFEFQAPDGAWHEGWAFDVEPVACRIGVYKRGWRDAVEGSVQTAEAKVYEPVKNAQGVTEWVLSERWKALIRMLKISAEADGLRRAFPQALSGFYTPEETRRIKKEREEAYLAKVAAEGRAARRERMRAAEVVPDEQGEPERHEVVEGVQEGVVVDDAPPVVDIMGTVQDLTRRARENAPEPPAPAAKPAPVEVPVVAAEPPPVDEAPAAPEPVVDDVPLAEEDRKACLLAELAEQATILSTEPEFLAARFTALADGEPLPAWSADLLLRVVTAWRKGVVSALQKAGRFEEAAAYGEWGPKDVDRVEVLFGRRGQ